MSDSRRQETVLPKPSKFVFEPKPRPRKFLTVPNLMSIGRVLLLIPLFYYLQKGPQDNGNLWAIVVMGIAVVSDMADGLIARWFHVQTDWGRVLDPLADKVWLGALAIFLTLPTRENPLPLQFLALILVRDVSIVAGSYYVFRRRGIVVAPNYLGKTTMFVIAMTLISYTINWAPPLFGWLTPLSMVWIASGFIVVSGAQYLWRFMHYGQLSSSSS